MNAERDEVIELLRGVERSSAASPAERARVEQRMWAAFDNNDIDDLGLMTNAPDRTSTPSHIGRPELLRVADSETATSRGVRIRPRWVLAAAATLIAVVAGIAAIARDTRSTDVSEQPEASSPLVTLDTAATTLDESAVEITTDGPLPAGRYRLTLGGVALAFELSDRLIAIEVQPDRVIFAAPGTNVRGAANQVTVFAGEPLADSEQRDAWLATRSETTQRVARAVDGERVDEFIVSVTAEQCRSFDYCVDIATSEAGDALQLMAGGVNRLMVDDRGDGSALIVLGRFENSIRDDTLVLYNELLESLTYIAP